MNNFLPIFIYVTFKSKTNVGFTLDYRSTTVIKMNQLIFRTQISSLPFHCRFFRRGNYFYREFVHIAVVVGHRLVGLNAHLGRDRQHRSQRSKIRFASGGQAGRDPLRAMGEVKKRVSSN